MTPTSGEDFTRIRYERPAPAIARVVLARPDTRNAVLDHAVTIASRPAPGLNLVKHAIRFGMDLQGQRLAGTAAFAMHHVGHAHARVEFGRPIDAGGVEVTRPDAKAASS